MTDEVPLIAPTPRTTMIRNWLVFGLMLVIAANEFQRTSAQASAHRERTEQSLTMRRIETKLDWLLLNYQPLPTSSVREPLPTRGRAASALRP